LGTQLPEVSLVVEVQKDTFQLGGIMDLSGRKDISQIVGIVDLVDLVDDKLTNEHLLLTKVKCLPPHSSLFFFWDPLKPPSLLSNPTNQGERWGSSNPESYGTM